ncbi:MAG TPA: hypothetical protein VK550_12200 [Polyangiaceae bacterium]|nr:hypothetical protein [Polyangiaceae bacterium]
MMNRNYYDDYGRCPGCGGRIDDGIPCPPPAARGLRGFWIAVGLIAFLMTMASVVHAKGRLFIKEGYVSDVRVEPDPTAVMVLVTSKFMALSLEQESAIANEVCTTVSVMSQADASREGVGLCEIVLVGTDNVMGATHFDDDGKAVTEWRPWYLWSKAKRRGE